MIIFPNFNRAEIPNKYNPPTIELMIKWTGHIAETKRLVYGRKVPPDLKNRVISAQVGVEDNPK